MMRSKARSSAGCATSAQIGERIADFRALVEARAADDAIGQAERDEALFELAHLERGAHQDRDLVERVALALQLLDLLADGAGFLFRVPRAVTVTFSPGSSSVRSVLPRRPSLWAIRCEAAARMWAVER